MKQEKFQNKSINEIVSMKLNFDKRKTKTYKISRQTYRKKTCLVIVYVYLDDKISEDFQNAAMWLF